MDNERPEREVNPLLNDSAAPGMGASASPPSGSVQRTQPASVSVESSGSIALGVVGGVVAAIVTGIVWALIVVVTDYEIGFAALGVGFVCGLGTILLGSGRGVQFQVVAVLTSILGIIIGKYGMYYHYFTQYVTEEYGEEALINISIFSGAVIGDFLSAIGSMLGGYDILWLILAVTTAWKTAALREEEAEE